MIKDIRKALQVVLLLSFICILMGCEDKKSVDTLGETEHYFDEKVTSISSGNGGVSWVGSETGRIWRVQGCSSEPFDVGSERVYKVVSADDKDGSSLLWIGIRNSGLQKWNMNSAGELNKLVTYKIPVKENHYSPYDILKFRNTIFTATTQGLYCVSVESESDSMKLIYPDRNQLSDKYNNSFPVKNMCVCNDSILWASTDHGALMVDLLNGKTKLVYNDINISHVSSNNDTLCILKENKLIRCEPDGTPIDSVLLQFSPKVYYQANQIHYFIDRDNMLLSKDLREFKMIPLRKKISDKCRNIIIPEAGSDYLLLLMEDTLWRIPVHSGIFNGNGLVKIACQGDHQMYYLSSDNILYLQKNDERACPVFSFPTEEQIVWMCASRDKIYYYNTEQEVKEVSISTSPLKNLIAHGTRTIYQSKHKITSACLKNRDDIPEMYLGIQDGLLLLNLKSGEVRELPSFSNRYVTSFFLPPHSKLLYLSTLNNGIFYSSADSVFTAISETKQHASVKDLIVTGSYPPQLISLTNHDILSHRSGDSILARGCNKLLYVNDTLFYTLSESGIRKLVIDSLGMLHDKGNYYTDIRFNPAASFVSGQKLYLGSDMGVLMLDAGNEDAMRWVSFKPDNFVNIKSVIVAVAFLVIGFLIYSYRHIRRRKANNRQLQKRVVHLSQCLEELKCYYNLTDEKELSEIKALEQEIGGIDVNSRNRKRLHVTIKRLTDEIIQRNRDVSFRLLKKLDDQIASMSAFATKEKDLMMAVSADIQKSNNLELIKNQLSINEKWMNEFTFLDSRLGELNTKLQGVIEIEGVNKDMMQMLESLNEGLYTKPLSEMMLLYRSLESAYDSLFTAHTLNVILSHADQMSEALRKRKTNDIVSQILIDRIEKAKQQIDPLHRLELLKDLEQINKRMEILRIIDQMQTCMESYTTIRDRIIAENDGLVNRRFDKDLESYIAGHTKAYVDNLEKLTVSFYKVLQMTDPFIINDVLKISSYYHQQAKVLALLIANPRVKRSLIPGMLGVYGNLNPVISRLINSKIKSNEDILKGYVEADNLNMVFVYYILKLID